ncbi:XIAP-associated factor 1 isoform X2 [Denticeps clupeoides]|uniref:XIAP-associated factor 1 isoform X2 n=1 Tax=Denticeps clupeoides TaxID=299321 RepID=UPI0010A4FC34|nr:XIAP-associated factor 1 isoform X2 [Denticeps clupeoides]
MKEKVSPAEMSDVEEQDQVPCKHCERPVAESNLTLHESHCLRFLCLCPDCDEPVARDQLEEHRVDRHTPVKCTMCGQKVERRHLPDHQSSECEERLACCGFCSLEIPMSRMNEHTVACGSRTEHCSGCGCYVRLKDVRQHSQTCSSSDLQDLYAIPNMSSKETQAVCSDCGGSFPSKYLEKHQLQCMSRSMQNISIKRDEDHKPDSDLLLSDFLTRKKGGFVQEISFCPHCDLALPLETLKWHEQKCRVKKSMKQPRREEKKWKKYPKIPAMNK